jgi:DNA-binding CsgD family transcriptional regulator
MTNSIADAPLVAAATDLPSLTPRQREVYELLAEGISLRSMARRLGISVRTLEEHRGEMLRKLNLPNTDALRAHAALKSGLPATSRGYAGTTRLRYQSHWLPNLTLSSKSPLGRECRARLNCHTLREVGDYLRDCDSAPASAPDDPAALLAQGTGTLGAKQALLAALALERGRRDLVLMVACHELSLNSAGANGERVHPQTLPLAVCYLAFQGRRLQIAAAESISQLNDGVVTEVAVAPHQLAAERIRLYGEFAADWCQALEVSPQHFAALRAEQLRTAVSHAVREDLLGHLLAPDYTPTPRDSLEKSGIKHTE